MKKISSLLSLVLLSSVSLTSCRIPGWEEEELMPTQENAQEHATRKVTNNLLYLHKEIKRHNNSAQDTFKNIVEQRGIVVVDFYADWCGPCRKLGSTLEQLAPQLPKVTFLKIDTDQFSDLSSSFNVRGIPALFFFKNGKQVKSTTGSKSAKELKKLIGSL